MSSQPLPPELESQPVPPEPPPPQARPYPPWSGWDIVLVALLTFFLLVVLGAISLGLAMQHPAFAGMQPDQVARQPVVFVITQTITYSLVIWFLYSLLRRRGVSFVDGLRLRLPEGHQAIVWILAGAALALAVQFISHFLPIPKGLPIEEYFRTPMNAWLLAFFGTLIAPAMEEFFFRGLLYPTLERRWGVVLASVAVAASFSLLHSGQLARAWAPLLLLFLVGLVFTLTRALTRSLAPALIMHIAYNFTLFFFLFVGTDGFRRMERLFP